MQKKKETILFILILAVIAQSSFSQMTDSTRKSLQIKGAVTVTTKGISFIPTFSLGKPAAIFDLSVGKKKLFFEPQLRFSLEGKPWSFLFWWRYKLITDKKFALTLGAHPAINFRKESFTINGVPNTGLIARRYLAGELSPNYFVSKNISVGLYYLYSRGLDHGTVRKTHFLTLNSNISRIKLGNQFLARFIPQFYFLMQDLKQGFYFTSTLTLEKKNFPLSLQSIINKTIESDITGSQDFVWNISLIYSFSKKYVKQQ